MKLIFTTLCCLCTISSSCKNIVSGLLLSQNAGFQLSSNRLTAIDKVEHKLYSWSHDLQDNKIFDLSDSTVLLKIFEAHFSQEYKARYRFNRKVAEELGGNYPSPKYSDLFAIGDTLYLFSSNYFVKAKDTIDALITLLKINEDKLVEAIPVSREIQDKAYRVQASDIYVYGNDIFIGVRKSPVGTDNAYLGKLMMDNSILKLKEILPFYLNKQHLEKGFDYNFTSLIRQNQYINHRFYIDVFDVKTLKVLQFPIYLEQTQKGYAGKRAPFAAYILDFFVSNNDFNIFYTSNDTLYSAKCMRNNEGFVLISNTVLTNNFADQEITHLVANKNGYYQYSRKNRTLTYTAYP